MDEPSINLLARWRQGDQQAAEELFRRYAGQLIALASSRLSSQVGRRVDAEDVVQSAYRSFFIAARDGCYDLQRGGDLWRLLVAITLHKLRDQVKHNRAGKRAVDREQADEFDDLFAQGPSPLQAATLADHLEHLMRGLNPTQRQVLELRLQGFHLEEIATQTRRSVRTVSRLLDQVREMLEAEENASRQQEP